MRRIFLDELDPASTVDGSAVTDVGRPGIILYEGVIKQARNVFL